MPVRPILTPQNPTCEYCSRRAKRTRRVMRSKSAIWLRQSTEGDFTRALSLAYAAGTRANKSGAHPGCSSPGSDGRGHGLDSPIPELPVRKNSQGISPVGTNIIRWADGRGVAIGVLSSYPAIAYTGRCRLLTARSRTPEI